MRRCSTENGRPFSHVTLELSESAKWRRLQPAELDPYERGDGRVSMMSNLTGFKHCWHVVPMLSDLDREGAFELPDVKTGQQLADKRLACFPDGSLSFVLPLALTHR